MESELQNQSYNLILGNLSHRSDKLTVVSLLDKLEKVRNIEGDSHPIRVNNQWSNVRRGIEDATEWHFIAIRFQALAKLKGDGGTKLVAS